MYCIIKKEFFPFLLIHSPLSWKKLGVLSNYIFIILNYAHRTRKSEKCKINEIFLYHLDTEELHDFTFTITIFTAKN